MTMISKSIDIFLTGVRADFADVEDQAQKQADAENSNVYLDSSAKTGALVNSMDVQGRQRAEFASVTGVSELLPTEEDQAYPETNYVPSYITSVEPYKFSRRIKVTREAVERRSPLYAAKLEEASKLQVALENTRAVHKFDVFNKGFSLYTDKHLFNYGDGVATFASNHPDKVGGTHANTVTASDVTSDAIEAMKLVLQNQVDDIGEPMPMGGGQCFIICPPEKVRKVKEVIDSEWRAGTANNNINVWYGGQFNIVSSPRLTSKTAFFLVDALHSPLTEVIFRAPASTVWYDENVKVYNYDIDFEHRVGTRDYRGMVGNTGL